MSKADLERKTWNQSNLSKLLDRLRIHHSELFINGRPPRMTVTHTDLCESKKFFGRCDCTVKVRVGLQEFIGG